MDERNLRLDLTGDRLLTKIEARKLARWWASQGFSAEMIWVRPGRFRVIATRCSRCGGAKYRRNADERIRELERRYEASGSPQEFDAWLRARTRADQLALGQSMLEQMRVHWNLRGETMNSRSGYRLSWIGKPPGTNEVILTPYWVGDGDRGGQLVANMELIVRGPRIADIMSRYSPGTVAGVERVDIVARWALSSGNEWEVYNGPAYHRMAASFTRPEPLATITYDNPQDFLTQLLDMPSTQIHFFS